MSLVNFNSKKVIVPSEYQIAVYEHTSNGRGSAYIDAVAGSGKTTTIEHCATLISPSEETVFLAFNKRIVEELQKRLPSHIHAATFHSVCFKALRKKSHTINMNADKVKILALKNLKATHGKYITTACMLVSKAKVTGLGIFEPISNDGFVAIAEHFNIELPDEEDKLSKCLEAATMLMNDNISAGEQSTPFIDFDDMLYMILYYDVRMPQFDNIVIDESQDTNKIQRFILKKMLKPGGRLIAVGDEKQAIYGFRGSDSEAIKAIKEEFACKEFPLYYCYRCSKAVVKFAQKIVPYIKAPDTAIEGQVIEAGIIDKQQFLSTDVILCRNTKPLIDFAFYLIGKGIGCKVLGKDIGDDLIHLVEKMNCYNCVTLQEKLENYGQREMKKFLTKYKEEKAEAIKDKIDCIFAIIKSLPLDQQSISLLKMKIASMFSNDTSGLLTLATSHRSKGLEWQRVFVYRPELMPSKYAKREWQLQQEANLQYVTYTRAKEILVILDGEVPERADGFQYNPHA